MTTSKIKEIVTPCIEIDSFLSSTEGDTDLDKSVLAKENSVELERILRTLGPREETVLRMRFGLHPYEKTYKLHEIGIVFGNAIETIRGIEARALRKLRNPQRVSRLKAIY